MAEDEIRVVSNHEGRHALWPAGRALPPGWVDTGFGGARAAAMAHVDAVWPDQRRRSIREVPHGRG